MAWPGPAVLHWVDLPSEIVEFQMPIWRRAGVPTVSLLSCFRSRAHGYGTRVHQDGHEVG